MFEFMRRALVAAACLLATTPALAQSTVNPNIPSQRDPLSSAPIRGNFGAAYSDINLLYARTAPLAGIASGHLLANTQNTSAPPVDTAATTWLDKAFCSTVGYVVARTTGGWACSKAISAPVTWFGASCNDGTAKAVTDDTAAINTALSSGALHVTVPAGAGRCFVPGGLTVSGSNINFGGSGALSSILSSNSTSTHMITLPGGSGLNVHDLGLVRFFNLTTSAATAAGSAVLNFTTGLQVPSTIVAGMTVKDLTNPSRIPAGTTVLSVSSTTVTMSANAVSGGVASGDTLVFAPVTVGNGINATGDIEQSNIYNMSLSNNNIGMLFLSSSYGSVHDNNVFDGRSHGFYYSNLNVAAGGNVQWNIYNNLSQGNAGSGYVFASVAGPPAVTFGDFYFNRTFGNAGNGVKIICSVSVPCNGFRGYNLFLGGDALAEFSIDSYGGQNSISNSYLELSGGAGFEATANNIDYSIANVRSNGNAGDCFTLGAGGTTTHVSLNGSWAYNCGTSGTVYGIRIADGAKTIVNNNTIYGNFTAAFTATANATQLTGCGNNVAALNNCIQAGSSIQNSWLANPSLTVNGVSIALGGSGTIASSMTVGTTPIVSGSSNAILFDTSGGLLGAITTQASSILTTNTSGVPSWATSVNVARNVLTGNLTEFVRTDGNDANCTGLTNAAYVSGSFPQNCGFATIQKAYDNLADKYDLRGFTATIQVGNGTYNAGLATSKCVVGQNGTPGVQILGSATPANVLISVTSNDAFGLGQVAFGAGTQGCTQITIGGMKLQTTTAGNLINVSGGGVGVTVGTPGFPIDFGASAQNHMVANHAGWIIAGANNTISGSAGVAHVAALSSAVVATHNTTETCTGSPSFLAFAYAESGYIYAENVTYSGCGTATGPRYFASTGGYVYALTDVTTYLPGSAAGSEYSGGQYVMATPVPTYNIIPPQGRLTLASGTPVMATTQINKTTIYYTPYQGGTVPIFDGLKTASYTFAELSIATTDTTKNPSAIGANKVNDWFVWNDAGTLRLGHGPDWTSDTARSAGTLLVSLADGLLHNGTAITNGPGAQRGTYVGTTRSDPAGQLNWVYGGQGTAALLHVWNAYNRLPVSTQSSESSSSWSYTSATTRQANNTSTTRVAFVTGLAEETVLVDYVEAANIANVANAYCSIGFGLDSTTTMDRIEQPTNVTTSAVLTTNVTIPHAYAPQLGAHFVQALEGGDGTNATTFIGGSGKMGLRVTTRM